MHLEDLIDGDLTFGKQTKLIAVNDNLMLHDPKLRMNHMAATKAVFTDFQSNLTWKCSASVFEAVMDTEPSIEGLS